MVSVFNVEPMNIKIKDTYNKYNFDFLDKINKIKKLNKNINKEYFNNIFKEYINDDVIRLIIIINSIQLYNSPKLTD
jgi:hypothetical protein